MGLRTSGRKRQPRERKNDSWNLLSASGSPPLGEIAEATDVLPCGACHKSTEVDGCHDTNVSAALATPMSPVIHLVLAILIGMAVGLFTALRRYGGFVTFIVSTASLTLVLRTTRLRPIGFVASAGGVGILLVILGVYVSLAIWAHERVRKTK